MQYYSGFGTPNFQLLFCAMPLRLDMYKGCNHGCDYCFAAKRHINNEDFYGDIKPSCLSNLVKIFNSKEVSPIIGHRIPIHIGGMSDPFQPCEKHYRLSMQFLQYLLDNPYPCVWSTKGIIVKEYAELIKKTKGCVQISCIGKRGIKTHDKNAPNYEKRIGMIEALKTEGVPVVVRIQPMFLQYIEDVKLMVIELCKLRVNGIVIEGLKQRAKFPGSVKLGGEQVYSIRNKLNYIIPVRDICRSHGVRFFVGDNNLRQFGDGSNCCGFGNVPGFERENPCNVTATNSRYFTGNELFDNQIAEINMNGICSIALSTFKRDKTARILMKNKLNSGDILQEIDTLVQVKLQEGEVVYRQMTELEIMDKYYSRKNDKIGT